MRQFFDVLRYTVISPELLAIAIALVLYTYDPELADVLVQAMKGGIAVGLGAALFPLGMLAFNYKEGFELLAPTGTRKVLLEWPGYPMLKGRVFASFIWCVLGAFACIVGTWMVAAGHNPRAGVALLVAGILCASASTATIAIARFRAREILGV